MQSQSNTNMSPFASTGKGINDNNNMMKEKRAVATGVAPLESSAAALSFPAKCSDPTDDLDIMLLHEDFPYLLAVAAKAKETRRKIQEGDYAGAADVLMQGGPPTLTNNKPHHLPKNACHPDQIIDAVDRMHEALLQRPGSRATIPRGRFPITDSIMVDSMLLLQEEHEKGEKWLDEQPLILVPKRMPEYDPSAAATKKRGRGVKGGKDTNSAIAVKYAKWQTDILMQWMIEHFAHPFPDEQAVEWLQSQTGLAHSQVINWTTNVRKRNRKATCEGSKKPHHFIDFLFLAQDRDEKAGVVNAATRTSQSRQQQPYHHRSSYSSSSSNSSSSNSRSTQSYEAPSTNYDRKPSPKSSNAPVYPPDQVLSRSSSMPQYQSPSAPVPDQVASMPQYQSPSAPVPDSPPSSSAFERNFHEVGGDAAAAGPLSTTAMNEFCNHWLDKNDDSGNIVFDLCQYDDELFPDDLSEDNENNSQQEQCGVAAVRNKESFDLDNDAATHDQWLKSMGLEEDNIGSV